MSRDTRDLSDCKASDPFELFQNAIEGVLDTPALDPFDQLLLAQIARRSANYTAIVCKTSLAQLMRASPTKVRNSLDRLQAKVLIRLEVQQCRCSGAAERFKISIYPAKLGGR